MLFSNGNEEFKEIDKLCLRLYLKKDYCKAKNEIEEFLKNHPLELEDDVEYHYFSSFLEKTLFDTLIPHSDNVKILEDDYCRIFNMYASILIAIDDYPKAKHYLSLAHKLNPLDYYISLNLVSVFDWEMNYHAIETTLKQSLKLAYDVYGLFDIYGRLASFYSQMGEKEISEVLFELKSKRSFEDFDISEVKKLFDKYGLQLGFDRELLEAYHYAYLRLRDKGNFMDEYSMYQDYLEVFEINEYIESECGMSQY